VLATADSGSLRRRLSEREELLVGPAVDVRGTDEAMRRALLLPPDRLALVPDWLLLEELGTTHIGASS
jgi:hypothetical protein